MALSLISLLHFDFAGLDLCFLFLFFMLLSLLVVVVLFPSLFPSNQTETNNNNLCFPSSPEERRYYL
jgi:membrane-associated PAP2 superfamily phosphatase